MREMDLYLSVFSVLKLLFILSHFERSWNVMANACLRRRRSKVFLENSSICWLHPRDEFNATQFIIRLKKPKATETN